MRGVNFILISLSGVCKRRKRWSSFSLCWYSILKFFTSLAISITISCWTKRRPEFDKNKIGTFENIWELLKNGTCALGTLWIIFKLYYKVFKKNICKKKKNLFNDQPIKCIIRKYWLNAHLLKCHPTPRLVCNVKLIDKEFLLFLFFNCSKSNVLTILPWVRIPMHNNRGGSQCTCKSCLSLENK